MTDHRYVIFFDTYEIALGSTTQVTKLYLGYRYHYTGLHFFKLYIPENIYVIVG